MQKVTAKSGQLHVSAALLTVTVEDVIKRFCVQRFISRRD